MKKYVAGKNSERVEVLKKHYNVTNRWAFYGRSKNFGHFRNL